MKLASATIVLVLHCFASRVSAQTAVLFSVGGDAALAAAHSDEVLARVHSDLEDDGMTVLSGDALAQAVASAHADGCADPSCAGPLLAQLHADIGVGVALWPHNGVVQIAVVLVDASAHEVSATSDGADTVIGQTTRSALSQARARWATRDGSPVRVTGSPDGAAITIDHQPVGSIPYEGRLAPGTHHFAVAAPGHVAERRDLEVAAATEPVTITFDLAVGEEVEPTPPATGGPDVGLIIAGVAIGAAGLVVASIGLANATTSERCASACDGPAAGRTLYEPNRTADAVEMIAGGVALIVGVVVAVYAALSGGASRSSIALTSDGVAVSY